MKKKIFRRAAAAAALTLTVSMTAEMILPDLSYAAQTVAGTETAGTGDADKKSTRKQSESTEETGRTGEKESSEVKGNIEGSEEETTAV